MTTNEHKLRVRAGSITAAIVLTILAVGVVIFTLPVIGVALSVLLFIAMLASASYVFYELVLESIKKEKTK